MSFKDKVADWRNRLIANPRFQRWAAAFALTRPIAEANARHLFDLTAGFVYSQTLFACVQLRLFDDLRAAPRSIAEIAASARLDPQRVTTLILAARSLRLVETRADGRVALGELGAALVGNRAILDMIEHHASLYADLADPLALLRQDGSATNLARYWAYADAGDPAALASDSTNRYTALMASSQALVADDILDAVPMRRAARLLDVGGGAGAFAAAALARNPQLTATIFDLPSVAETARGALAALGLSDRATVVGGNFHKDALPRGADTVTLVRVLHDHDDGPAFDLLRAIRAAVADGARLIVAEPMAETKGAAPVGHAYFGMYLLAMGSGRPRTSKEIIRMAREAGFRSAQITQTRRPMLVRAITAIA